MTLASKLESAARVRPLELTFRGGFTTTSTSFFNTFTGVPLGAAESDRLVIVTAGNRPNPSPPNVVSVSVGGVSATKQSGTTPVVDSIWTAIVPSGTTATVIVTNDAASVGLGVSVYTVTGGASRIAKQSANSVVASGTNPVTTTMNVSKGDVVIMVASNDSGASGGVVLVGATEDVEYNQISGSRGSYASGSAVMTATEAGRTFSATFDGTSKNGLAVAAFNK